MAKVQKPAKAGKRVAASLVTRKVERALRRILRIGRLPCANGSGNVLDASIDSLHAQIAQHPAPKTGFNRAFVDLLVALRSAGKRAS